MSKPYISVDIETTGLEPDWCQVIEVGVVIDDWVTPIDQLPRWHTYVDHEQFTGQPYALSMHSEIFRRIALKEKYPQYQFLKPTEVGHVLARWLRNHGFDPEQAILAAGKNFAGFDRPFLDKLPRFSNKLHFHHRVVDPGMLFWNPETDNVPPSSKQCMERAGQEGEVAHTAVEDALMVIGQVRKARERIKLIQSWMPYIESSMAAGDMPYLKLIGDPARGDTVQGAA